MQLGDVHNRISLAIISNANTPYRTHLHMRIVRELPQTRLYSIFTHDQSNAPWSLQAPPEINPVFFGAGENSADAAKSTRIFKEWHKGGRIIRWLKQNHIQAVVMCGYADAGRMRVIRWCHKHHVPCFVFGDSNIHGDRASGLRARFKQMEVGRVVKWAAGMMPCGTLGAQFFKKYGAADEHIFYFPYEPDYELIHRITQEDCQKVLRRYGLAAGRRRIVFSGRLEEVKQPGVLLDAFIRIAPQRPDWDLLMIGDGSLRNSLLERVPAELEQCILWTGFVDDQSLVSALYRVSDVLVLPSSYEPWALVINEAAAAGLAIVSSEVVGASAELVRDGTNGRLFPVGDVEALAGALLDVTQPARLSSMREASGRVLDEWRRRGDPVAGLRRALQSVNLLPADKVQPLPPRKGPFEVPAT